VGYSRQSGADEVGTLARLHALRTEVLDPLLAEHRGRLFKTVGDGFLAEFSSAVQAASCALAIQSRLAERGAAAAGEQLKLRIGVHQGDVVVQGDDLMGDGINIAGRSRLIPPMRWALPIWLVRIGDWWPRDGWIAAIPSLLR